MKYLVSITPAYYICFVSNLFAGGNSDRVIVESGGVLDMLDAGDAITVEKQYKVSDFMAVKTKI